MATFAGLIKVMDSTEETATVLKNVIVALIKPQEKAKKVFKDIGIETGLLAVQQEGLFNIFEKIIEATETHSDVITELFPNVRSLTGALALNKEKMVEMREVYELVKTDIGETSSATIAFEQHMESLNKRMDITKAKIKEQSIALGKTLKPAWLGVLEIIEGFIERIRFVIKWFGILSNTATASSKIMIEIMEADYAAIQEFEEKTTLIIQDETQKKADIKKIITEKEKAEIEAKRKAEIEALTKAGLEKAALAKKEREDEQFFKKQELESERFITTEILAIEDEGRKLTENAEKKHLENLDALRESQLNKDIERIQKQTDLIYGFATDIGVAIENALLDEEEGLNVFLFY